MNVVHVLTNCCTMELNRMNGKMKIDNLENLRRRVGRVNGLKSCKNSPPYTHYLLLSIHFHSLIKNKAAVFFHLISCLLNSMKYIFPLIFYQHNTVKASTLSLSFSGLQFIIAPPPKTSAAAIRRVVVSLHE